MMVAVVAVMVAISVAIVVMRYSELGEAIRSHNAVGAGLSSSIFTTRLGRPHATGVGSIHVERSCAALDDLLRDQHFIDTIEAW